MLFVFSVLADDTRVENGDRHRGRSQSPFSTAGCPTADKQGGGDTPLIIAVGHRTAITETEPLPASAAGREIRVANRCGRLAGNTDRLSAVLPR